MMTEAGRERVRVLFVCLGNICRSPLAEGLFRSAVAVHGLSEYFEIDSAGTAAWHIGKGPDHRMRELASSKGILIDSIKARQFQALDLERFDHIFAMDKDNQSDMLSMDPADNYGHRVRLYREFDSEPGNYQVPDPYYGGSDGFKEVFVILERTAHILLHHLAREHDLPIKHCTKIFD